MITLTNEIPLDTAESVLLSALSNGSAFKADNAIIYPDGERLIISGIPTNTEEIKFFAKMHGCKNVLSCADLKMDGKLIESGETMRFLGNKVGNSADVFPDYKSVYSIMTECFEMPDYNEFLPSIHAKIQSQNARIYSLENSVAVVYCVRDVGFLNAICTCPTAQNKGEGSRLLSKICNDFKCIYLYKEIGKHDYFYKNAGFEKYSQFSLREIKF